MDLLHYLKRLQSYDDWANREVFNSFRAAKPTDRTIRLIAHIAGTEREWLWRIQKRGPAVVWPDWNAEQSEREFNQISSDWKHYLESLTAPDLERPIDYKNTKGQAYTNTVQDIAMHVFMHSAYHRGQIATDTRAAGNTPTYTDFIQGVRAGCVEG